MYAPTIQLLLACMRARLCVCVCVCVCVSVCVCEEDSVPEQLLVYR